MTGRGKRKEVSYLPYKNVEFKRQIMLSNQEINKLKVEAGKKGLSLSQCVNSYRYAKQRQEDLLQPSDPAFKKVWGEKINKQENRQRKDKENMEEKAVEAGFENHKSYRKKMYFI